MDFFISIILLILSFWLLYFFSDVMIDNGSLVAKRYNLSSIVIGATIVAIGTSLPELLVSIYSIIFLENNQASSMIVGNILGSNIANVSLVLGFCGLFYKIIFENKILYDLLLITLLGVYVILCISNSITINFFHGIVLFIIFFIYLYNLIQNNKILNDKRIDDFFATIVYSKIVVSMIGLSLGTKLAVENAIYLSTRLGLDELAISLSVVAIGTSLPELFACMISLKKKKYGLLIGNIIGSNVINIVFVLGLSSLFVNINITNTNNNLSYLFLVFIISHLVLIFSYLYNKELYRFYGFILLLFYLFFLYQLFLIRV